MKQLNPFSAAHHDDTQFMENFGQLSGPAQRVIIGIVFLLLLVLIVILRDMVKTEETHEI